MVVFVEPIGDSSDIYRWFTAIIRHFLSFCINRHIDSLHRTTRQTVHDIDIRVLQDSSTRRRQIRTGSHWINVSLNTRNASSGENVQLICFNPIKLKVTQSLEKCLVIFELVSKRSWPRNPLHRNKMIKNLLLRKKGLPVTCIIKVLIEILGRSKVASTCSHHFILGNETSRSLVPVSIST